MSKVDDFIRDLRDAVWDAKGSPAGKGNMVTLYGTCSSDPPDRPKTDDVRLGLGNSSAIGPEMVGAIVSAFLDAMYKA